MRQPGGWRCDGESTRRAGVPTRRSRVRNVQAACSRWLGYQPPAAAPQPFLIAAERLWPPCINPHLAIGNQQCLVQLLDIIFTKSSFRALIAAFIMQHSFGGQEKSRKAEFTLSEANVPSAVARACPERAAEPALSEANGRRRGEKSLWTRHPEDKTDAASACRIQRDSS